MGEKRTKMQTSAPEEETVVVVVVTGSDIARSSRRGPAQRDSWRAEMSMVSVALLSLSAFGQGEKKRERSREGGVGCDEEKWRAKVSSMNVGGMRMIGPFLRAQVVVGMR